MQTFPFYYLVYLLTHLISTTIPSWQGVTPTPPLIPSVIAKGNMSKLPLPRDKTWSLKPGASGPAKLCWFDVPC